MSTENIEETIILTGKIARNPYDNQSINALKEIIILKYTDIDNIRSAYGSIYDIKYNPIQIIKEIIKLEREIGRYRKHLNARQAIDSIDKKPQNSNGSRNE